MGAYLVRRLLFIVPTLLGIMTINFLIIQAAPGGPVEQTIAKVQGFNTDATERISGSGMVSPDLTSGCLEYLMILICLSTILPSGALIAMYVAIQAGKIHNTLELKLHIGSHGRLTKTSSF